MPAKLKRLVLLAAVLCVLTPTLTGCFAFFPGFFGQVLAESGQRQKYTDDDLFTEDELPGDGEPFAGTEKGGAELPDPEYDPVDAQFQKELTQIADRIKDANPVLTEVSFTLNPKSDMRGELEVKSKIAAGDLKAVQAVFTSILEVLSSSEFIPVRTIAISLRDVTGKEVSLYVPKRVTNGYSLDATKREGLYFNVDGKVAAGSVGKFVSDIPHRAGEELYIAPNGMVYTKMSEAYRYYDGILYSPTDSEISVTEIDGLLKSLRFEQTESKG